MNLRHATSSAPAASRAAAQFRFPPWRCALALALGLAPLAGCGDGDETAAQGLPASDGQNVAGAGSITANGGSGTQSNAASNDSTADPDPDPLAAEWVPDCEVESDLLKFVDSTMQNYYLWNEELPEITLSDYSTPEDVLKALRYEDDRWSAIFPEPDVTAFYAGLSVGLGFRQVHTWKADGSYRPRISLVYEDSPAMAAGLERGMTILAVNGVPALDILNQGLWGSITGADEVGVEVELLVQRMDGTQQDVTLTKAELQRTSVSVTRVVNVDGRRVGYVMFEQFIVPSQAALAEAFTLMAEQGATELVLDLRYNTGGLVDVAAYLGSLIVGPAHAGETFLRFDFNDDHPELDGTLYFSAYPESIPFSRVAFLVSGSTASASEALINALDPYIEVHLVGLTTLGKPVGSNSFPFCGKILQPITFLLTNVNGEADFLHGFAPDCEMDDDFDHQLGDPQEARFAAALGWLSGNPCPPDIVPNASGLLALPGAGAARHAQEGTLVIGSGVNGSFGIF